MELDFDKYKKEQFCLNKECVNYGKKDAENIRIKSRNNNQVYCKSCKSSWVITKGTMFYNLKKPVSLVLEVLIMLSEGMGVNAIYRIKGVKSETISNWIIKASKHVEAFSSYLKQNMRLTQCQIDEFWAFIYKKKANVRTDETGRKDRGDRWGFVNVLPDSGFIHTVHNGPRNQEEADKFIAKIKAHSDGQPPLFISDGWSSYQEPLEKHYSTCPSSLFRDRASL